MSRYYYDLHLHSCLSPCAEDDMSPANIAGMGSLCGLQFMALTDHNSCGNCRSFVAACRSYGIVGVPGMELTTAEEIHLVCLFPTVEAAEAFDEVVKTKRFPIKNKPAVFGNQLYMDAQDNILGEEPNLLIPATRLDLEAATALALAHGGAAFPAHIDRPSNGIIGILGSLPEKPFFPTLELNDPENREAYAKQYGLETRRLLCSSDSHRLESMRDASQWIELEDEPYSSQKVRDSLIALLREGMV
ncbi:MAG: PHP domain-containing protein [Oscillospiraceae bacterium]|nr:PHP domain-containing protein [Oscillospiraceae bacterium]